MYLAATVLVQVDKRAEYNETLDTCVQLLGKLTRHTQSLNYSSKNAQVVLLLCLYEYRGVSSCKTEPAANLI